MMGEAFQTIGRRFEERIGQLSDEERREIGLALELLQQKVFTDLSSASSGRSPLFTTKPFSAARVQL